MRGKWILLSVSIVLLGVLGGAVSLLREQQAATRRSRSVKSARSAVPPPAEELSLPARLEAQQIVPAGAEATGSVQEFLVDVGQEVYEGQVLAHMSSQGLETTKELASQGAEAAQARVNKLESDIVAARLEVSRARADATRARIEFEQADRNYRRQKLLHENGATPRLTYEKSESDFQNAQAQFRGVDELARQADSRLTALNGELESAKKMLEDKRKDLEDAGTEMSSLEVRSPVQGLIVNRRGEVGKEHDAGAPMFDIAVNLSNLQAVVDADPSFVARIHPGQPATVIAAEVNQGLPGTVKELRNSQIVVAFVSPNPALRPGMTAQVRIKAE